MLLADAEDADKFIIITPEELLPGSNVTQKTRKIKGWFVNSDRSKLKPPLSTLEEGEYNDLISKLFGDGVDHAANDEIFRGVISLEQLPLTLSK